MTYANDNSPIGERRAMSDSVRRNARLDTTRFSPRLLRERTEFLEAVLEAVRTYDDFPPPADDDGPLGWVGQDARDYGEFPFRWHVQQEFSYPPAARIIIHPDDWRWKEGEHHAWREHPGRGYWKGQEWAPF